MTKMEWLTAHGFNEDGITYCVYGDDTYSIKNWLKEQGCKFDKILKWHCPIFFPLPEGYSFFEVKMNEIMEWQEKEKSMLYYSEAEDIIKNKLKEIQGPAQGEYYNAEIGTRIRNITTVFYSKHSFNSIYGEKNIYTFMSNNIRFVWITLKELDLKLGDIINLTGTIKEFNKRENKKQTILSRCIIEKI